MLDIETASAVAPGANIAVYFAQNTNAGLVNAIITATRDKINKSLAVPSFGRQICCFSIMGVCRRCCGSHRLMRDDL
jgi:subtilase family serine protease